MIKEQAQASPLGSLAHNPISLNATSPFSHALSLDKAEIGNREGKRKPNEPLNSRAPCGDNSVEPQCMDKPNHVTPMQKDKKVAHGQKVKKKGRDFLSKSGGSSKPLTTWKAVNTNPFAPSFEATTKPNTFTTPVVPDTAFKEFKAGGSLSSMGVSSEPKAMEENFDIGSGG